MPTTEPNDEIIKSHRTSLPMKLSSRNVMRTKHQTSRKKLLKRPRQFDPLQESAPNPQAKDTGRSNPGLNQDSRTNPSCKQSHGMRQHREHENGCTNQLFNKSGLACTLTLKLQVPITAQKHKALYRTSLNHRAEPIKHSKNLHLTYMPIWSWVKNTTRQDTLSRRCGQSIKETWTCQWFLETKGRWQRTQIP